LAGPVTALHFLVKKEPTMRGIFLLMFVAGNLITAVHADDGLIKRISNYSVSETLDRYENSVRERGMTVFARIDHSQGAAKVGKALRPTQLLVFGNPKVGTLLMQGNQAAGIDLPMKALAWEDDKGQVWLAYNRPEYLAERHGIRDRDPVLEKMRKALRGFCARAVGSQAGDVQPD